MNEAARPETKASRDDVTPPDTVIYITFDTQDFAGKRPRASDWEWNPNRRDVKRWRSWTQGSALDRSARTAGGGCTASLYVGLAATSCRFHYIVR